MDFISTNVYGEENGYIRHSGAEIIIGATDSEFVVKIQNQYYDSARYGIGCMLFAPDTEYGGIVRAINPQTEDKWIKLKGPTWRGLLEQQAFRPEVNDYIYLNGEANTVIRNTIARLDLRDTFTVSEELTSFVFSNYQVPLQSTLLEGLVDGLASIGARLDIKYKQGRANDKGYVLLSAKPVVDYSKKIEISEDSAVKMDIEDNRNGVNHMIALGKGERAARDRVDLYVWPNGSIQKQPYYTGINRRTIYYENTSAESVAALETDARKKLEDLKNFKQLKMSIGDMDLELGDIVGGRERITNITMSSPVVKKTLNVTGKGRTTISYKLKGEE